MNIADEIVVLADGSVQTMGSRDKVLPEIIGTQSAVSPCRRIM